MTAFNAAVVSVSDTRQAETDVSGDRLAALIGSIGAAVTHRQMATDDREPLAGVLAELCGRDDIDVIFTTGGTGLGPRDNTPEATLAVIEREAPGLAEAMRQTTAAITPTAILSRGVCGIRGRTLIVNLPGSPKAVEECFAAIEPVLGHAIRQIAGVADH